MSCLLVILGAWKVSITLCETRSDGSLEIFAGISRLKVFILNIFKVEIVHNKSGWEDVALIDILHEGLDSSPLDEFLFVEGAFDLLRVACNSGNEEMRESVFLTKSKFTLFPSS